MTGRMLVELARSDCPIFRFKSPLSRGRLKGKDHGKLSIHYSADCETNETYRMFVSVKQLSLYEAVAEVYQEYKILRDRSGEPVVEGESMSSLVRSVIQTEMFLHCDDQSNITTTQHEVIFLTDAVFLNFVEIGQYFMTKDTADSSQFYAVACRENAHPKSDGSQSRDGSRETQKLDPYWKLRPVVFLANMELRSEFCL